jgi:K+-transporting ATPase KdpC subunit
MMLQNFTRSFTLLILLVVIVCGLYPAALWIIGQNFFPFQANGSLLLNSEGKLLGSKLIAQPFTQDEYFHPRPSAASYNAAASASSSLAASNDALRERVVRLLKTLVTYQDGKMVTYDRDHSEPNLPEVPGDLVTTSGSGLDPHITLQNAEFQLGRVVVKWAEKLKRNPNELRNEIQEILNKHAYAPLAGLSGEKIVNVLELNLALHKFYNIPY